MAMNKQNPTHPTAEPTLHPTAAALTGSKARHVRHQNRAHSHTRMRKTMPSRSNCKCGVGCVGCVGNIYNTMKYK